MNSLQEELKSRTKKVGANVIFLVDELPNKPSGWVIAKQIVASGTSVGANYRSACRAKSTADFVNKLKIVVEEADETLFWLELLEETKLIAATRVRTLKKEIDDIIAFLVSSLKTLTKTDYKPSKKNHKPPSDSNDD